MEKTYKGIDVSGAQKRVAWSKTSKVVDFAILKAGGSNAGFYTADRFEENYAAATKYGVPLGAYYFVGPDFKSAADGKADAERFLKIVKGKSFSYPLFLDVDTGKEAPQPKNRVGNTEAAIAFCETIENAGYYVGIYSSSEAGFIERLDDSKLTAYDHWVADYRYKDKPGYKGEYGMWQYTEDGRVEGITGNVDMDIAYKDYPTIIKEAGLNGFAKNEKPSAPVKPTPAPGPTPAPVPTKPAQPAPAKPAARKAGDLVVLRRTPLYASATATEQAGTVSGSYYLYDGEEVNGRYRVTIYRDYCGRTPIGAYVTGWVSLK